MTRAVPLALLLLAAAPATAQRAAPAPGPGAARFISDADKRQGAAATPSCWPSSAARTAALSRRWWSASAGA